jgi:hypothetical protein
MKNVGISLANAQRPEAKPDVTRDEEEEEREKFASPILKQGV